MTKIKAAVFDLEGTVIDVEYAHHQAHILSAKDFGIVLSLEDCFAQIPHFIGGPDEEVARDISRVAQQSGREAGYRAIHESKKGHYNRLLKELPIKPREGFMDVLRVFKEMGLRYAIGSLTDEEQAKVLLERGGLAELFGYANIVLKEHVKRLKPAPDVWMETARRISVEPESQLVFEDSPRGIKGAVEIGAYCIGMPTYNRPDVIGALVNAGAKRIFMQWDEMNPTMLIQNVNKERC